MYERKNNGTFAFGLKKIVTLKQFKYCQANYFTHVYLLSEQELTREASIH